LIINNKIQIRLNKNKLDYKEVRFIENELIVSFNEDIIIPEGQVLEISYN